MRRDKLDLVQIIQECFNHRFNKKPVTLEEKMATFDMKVSFKYSILVKMKKIIPTKGF